MKKFRLSLATLTLAALTPLHQFKADVKTAGKETGHAIGNAGHAVAHGAKTAGHAIANTTRNGYHKTKRWVKEKT